MHARFRRVVAALTLLCGTTLLAAQSQPATPQPPTFRSEVEYVEVDTVVTDAEGTLVSNLTKDDFEIFEDGTKQSIGAFSSVDIPLERESETPFAALVEPDAQSDEGPAPMRGSLP